MWFCPSYHLAGSSPLPTFSSWWLFSSELYFWSSHRRRWAHSPRPLLDLLTVPWNYHGTSGCVISLAGWRSRSSLVCHLGQFDSNWFMLCPWATSFFQKLWPVPFPPVTSVHVKMGNWNTSRKQNWENRRVSACNPGPETTAAEPTASGSPVAERRAYHGSGPPSAAASIDHR